MSFLIAPYSVTLLVPAAILIACCNNAAMRRAALKICVAVTRYEQAQHALRTRKCDGTRNIHSMMSTYVLNFRGVFGSQRQDDHPRRSDPLRGGLATTRRDGSLTGLS